MVTIWCACGAVSFPSGNPVRDVPVEQRLALVAAGPVRGLVTLAVDPQWHPGGETLDGGCAALFADLDLAGVVVGLAPADAALVEALWITPRDDDQLVLDEAVGTSGTRTAGAQTTVAVTAVARTA